MIHRDFIHFEGPAGAGKTALIERLLISESSKLLLASRCEEDERLTEPQESASRKDEELNRYRDAGASGSMRFRFPPDASQESFFLTDMMQDYSQGVLVEGDAPPGFFFELTVFVAPPLPPGEALLLQVEGGPGFRRRQALARSRRKHGSKEAEYLASVMGFGLGTALRGIDSKREVVSFPLSRRGTGSADLCWILAPGYEAMAAAQVVVINVRSPDERLRAEAMLQGIARIRKDKAIFRDVVGTLGDKRPITAVVADLSDPKDKGLKRALTRIRRVFKPKPWEKTRS